MSEEEFREWANKRSHLPLAVKGHSLLLKGDNTILVDGGQFVYEDALQIVRMLNSKNPIAHFNASVMIWERNGVLRFMVLGLIAVIAALVFLLVRH